MSTEKWKDIRTAFGQQLGEKPFQCLSIDFKSISPIKKNLSFLEYSMILILSQSY